MTVSFTLVALSINVCLCQIPWYNSC